MDIFDFPDDWKPERPLTKEQSQDITNYLLNHPLFMKELPEKPEENEHLSALMELKEEDDPNDVAEYLNVYLPICRKWPTKSLLKVPMESTI